MSTSPTKPSRLGSSQEPQSRSADPEKRALDLFEELMDASAAEQAERLQAITAEDGELARRLGDLLAADMEADDTLDRPAVKNLHRLGPGSGGSGTGGTRPSEGAELGPYRLLRRLGEGGMGEVWEAEQTEPVRRRVAIKVIREGLGSGEVVERFRNERQALALMSHPHIAAVLDAGATADGRPYFVMEKVHGQPITLYCDRHRLGIDARLALFRKICSAVQHAHQKGLVHRDLKASNILVTGGDGGGGTDEPLPKVIDFGIAKVLSGPMADLAARTEEGRLLGTPEAMSPEQAAGEDVDTRSDVYSLGVLLYELLSGHRPLELERLPLIEGLQAILEQEPLPPSQRVGRAGQERGQAMATDRATDFPSLERRLRDDLDWIVLRSLEKDREARYRSPADLSADLGRYLSDQPVTAGPPSTLYRLQKFVRRHRIPVTAAGAVLLALVLGLIVAAAGWNRAEKEAEAANRAAELLMSTFAAFDPVSAGGRMADAEPTDLLARGVEGARTELADQPRLRARLMATLGRVYRNRGEYARAGPLLEEALLLGREVHGESHPEVANSLRGLGWVAFADGDPERALDYFEQAVEIYAASPESAMADRASTLADLSVVLWKLGRARLAEPRIDSAVALAEGIPAALPGVEREAPIAVLTLANTLYVRGLVLTELGRWDGAAESLDRSLDLRLEILGEDHPQVGWALLDRGWLDRIGGRAQEAEKRLLRVIEIFEARFGSEHPDVAVARHAHAFALLDLGRAEAAKAGFARGLELRRSRFPEDHPDVATSLEGVAWADLALGNLSLARTGAERALRIRRQLYGEAHPEIGYLLDLLAREAWASGEVERAALLQGRCLDSLRESLGAGHPRLIPIASSLASAAYGAGDRESAYVAFAIGLEAADGAGWGSRASARVTAFNLGCLAALRGESELAFRHLEDAVARGYAGPGLRRDPDLDSLRQHPDFGPRLEALAQQAERARAENQKR